MTDIVTFKYLANSDPEVFTSAEVEVVIGYDPIPLQKTAAGESLRGRRYSHILSKHLEFNFIIDPAEVNKTYGSITGLQFFKNFFGSTKKKITFEGEEREVTIEGDRLQVDYLNGIKWLPQVTLKLITAYPVESF